MTASMRTLVNLLLFLFIVVQATGAATAGPADDLLPPPVRQTEKRSLGGNEDRVQRYYPGRGGIGAAFSPDGKLLVTSAGYQGMVLWDVASGRSLGQLPNASNNEGISVAFTPNGKQMIAANWGFNREGCPVSLWDVAKREKIRSLDDDVNDTPFTAAAIAPDGKTIALGSSVGRRNQALSICLWDIASGDEIGRIEGLANAEPQGRRNFGGGVSVFQAVAYSPDGRTLAVLLDGRIVLVEIATAKQRGQFTFTTALEGRGDRQGMTSGALAFAADGRTLLAGCSDGAIRRFDLRNGRELPPLPGHTGGVAALCCTPDGKSIHSYGADGQFYVWRVDSGREWKPKTGPLAEEALDGLWDVLRSDDPRDLFGCSQALAASPAQTVAYLRKHVTPVPKADMERIDRLVADLQKGDYNARKKAVVELRKIGAPAAAALRKTQERGYDELIRRLMLEFDNLAPSAEQVRAVRALAVLEQIGDAESRKLLEELGGGSPEAEVTLQAKAALDRLGKLEPAKAEPAPEALCETLGGDDTSVAYRAIRALANRPTAAKMLRERLTEIATKDTFNDDPKRVEKLLADLDSDDFSVRDQASKDLRNLGRLVLPTLRKALEAKQSAETKRRLEELVDEAAKGNPAPEMLRAGRALEALEMMGGAEAHQTLEALAKDARIKWLGEAAAESLKRQREEKR